MYDFEYCAAWPDELKDLSRRQYRLFCRVRNLEAAIKRVEPTEFDPLMEQLELAQQELNENGTALISARYRWGGQQWSGQKGGAG